MFVFSRTFLRFGEVVRDGEGYGGGRGTRHEMRLSGSQIELWGQLV